MTRNDMKSAGTAIIALLLLGGISACGNGEVREKCEDEKPYLTAVDGKRISVPEDLDPLDPSKEIPIPEAETPPRPEGARCLESPPSVLSK